jgi:hypothetical protein
MARFFRRGVSKIYFLPAVATPAAPTSIEITAGTDLTVDTSEIAGFSLTNAPIAVPDLAATFTKTINGEDTTDTSSITFYDQDTTTNAIRTALAKGTAGYIVLMPYGNVTTKRCEVWAVTSTGVNDTWTTGNEAARFVVSFSINAVPVQNAVLP